MIKNFRFLRGGENDDEIITQIEWNRRRDALAERYRNEINSALEEGIKIREEKEKKVSLWSKIWTQLKQPLIFVPITVFGGLFTLYWLLRLVDYLSKLK